MAETVAAAPVDGAAAAEEVAAFLRGVLGADVDIQPGARLVDDLALDSMQRLELLAWLSTRGADVGAAEVAALVTVRDVAGLVSQTTRPHGDTTEATATPQSWMVAAPTRRHDERFALSPLTPEIMPFLYQLAISEEVGFRWRFRGNVPPFEAFQAGLSRGVHVQFVVADRRSGEPVGHVVAYNADHNLGLCYVGGAFVPRLISSGLPMEVMAMFARYLFQVWPFRKLYLEVPEFNYTLIASGAGRYFDVEGRLTEHSYYSGRYWDEYLLALRRHHVGLAR